VTSQNNHPVVSSLSNSFVQNWVSIQKLRIFWSNSAILSAKRERERAEFSLSRFFFIYLIWFGLFFDLFLYFRWLICLISVNMAVVSRACCDNATSESIDVCGIRVAGNMESGREIVEEPVARVIEDKIFVAVGKSVKECKLMLFWALQNSGGKRICIIHVLQPSQMIPLSKFKKWKKTNLVYYFIFCYYDSSFFFNANYR